ncbi:MAG: tetratricopeptide repeat protein [bacterium]
MNVVVLILPRVLRSVFKGLLVFILMPVLLMVVAGCSLFPVHHSAPTAPDLAITHLPVSVADVGGYRQQAREAYLETLELASRLPPAERRRFEPESLRRLGDIALNLVDENPSSALAPSIPDSNKNPRPAENEEIRLALEAQHYYQRLLDNYPAYMGREQVLYQKARAEDLAGDAKAAATTLRQFVREFPESKHYGEAAFRLAELEFVEQDYSSASLEYSNVLALGQHNAFYADARYKQGWARFRQSDYAAAAGILMDLLGHYPVEGLQDIALLPAGERERVKDTLRAVNLSFDNLEGVNSLEQAVKERMTGSGDLLDLANVLFESLGHYYLEKGNFADAADTFARFARLYPLSPAAPEFDSHAIEALEKGGFEEDLLAAKKAFVKRYSAGAGFWAANLLEEQPQVMSRVRKYWLDIINYSAEAAASAPFDGAENWMRGFLQQFPADAKARDVQQKLGEWLFKRERFDDAAAAYERLAYNMGSHAGAAKAAFVAAGARLKVLEKGEPTKAGANDAGAGNLEAFQRSVHRLANTYPGQKGVGQLLLTAAQVSLDLGSPQEAVKFAQHALTRSTDHRTPNGPAWAMLGDARFELQDFKAAEQAFEKALKVIEEQDSKQTVDRKAVNEQLARAIFHQGASAQKRGDNESAIQHFLRLAERFPEKDTAAVALHDATALMLANDHAGQAIPYLKRFLEHYPRHELTGAIQLRLAVALEDTGKLIEAAQVYEGVAMNSPDAATSRKALLKAARLYKKGEKPWRFAEALDRYLDIYPTAGAETDALALELADFYVSKGVSKEARERYSQVLEQSTAPLSLTRAAMGMGRLVRDEYEQVFLIAPLGKTVKKKRRLLDQALGYFETVVREGGGGTQASTQEALYWMGYLNADYARALMDSERPGDLAGDALEEYALMLEEEAMPYEDDAISLHRRNLQLAQVEGYQSWTHKSLEQLKQLEPARYARPFKEIGLIETL